MTGEEFERIRRLGAFAKHMLAEPVFLDVLKGLKEDAISAWTNSKSEHDREACWRDLQAVGRLKAKLETLDQNYNVEMVRLEQIEQQKKRAAVRREELNRG